MRRETGCFLGTRVWFLEFSSLPCPSGTVELKDNNAPDMLHHVQMLNLLLLFIVIDDSLAQKTPSHS